jgi:hypothetical protein
MPTRSTGFLLAAAALLATPAFAQDGPRFEMLTPQQMVQILDRNNNRTLEPSEVARSPLQAVYSRMDADRDGRLSVDEIVAYRAIHGEDITATPDR